MKADTLYTLRMLLEEHPEWADLPIAITDSVGELHYVNRSGSVFQGEDEEEQTDKAVLIFAGN